MPRDLTELPRLDGRLGYLYLEKGHIQQHQRSVAYVTEDDEVPIPAAGLALLLLGPGTTISHAAVRNLADLAVQVVWVGEKGVRFYCHGKGGTHLATNLLRQASLWADQRSRRRVVRRMYAFRFGERLDPKLSIEQIRGKEGMRVRNAYKAAAVAAGVPWQGRSFDPFDWTSGDPLNRGLSAASACLNGLAHAAVLTAGYSPGLGFVHAGKQLSFVYDVADLYKVDLLVPLVFRLVGESEDKVERRVRLACRDLFHERRLLGRILPDVAGLLTDPTRGDDDGGADPGEGAAGPARRPEPLDDRTEGRDVPRPHDGPHA